MGTFVVFEVIIYRMAASSLRLSDILARFTVAAWRRHFVFVNTHHTSTSRVIYIIAARWLNLGALALLKRTGRTHTFPPLPQSIPVSQCHNLSNADSTTTNNITFCVSHTPCFSQNHEHLVSQEGDKTLNAAWGTHDSHIGEQAMFTVVPSPVSRAPFAGHRLCPFSRACPCITPLLLLLAVS